jgi:hypothetical protein
MLAVTISRAKAFVIWSKCNPETIVVYHSHSFSSPKMGRQPTFASISQLIGSYKMSTFPNVFAAFW